MKNLKMLFNIFLLFSSLLLGSTISRIIAKILVFQKGLNLFPSAIQGTEVISAQLARSKSYDMVEFFLFFVISLIIFGFFYFLYRNKKFSIQQEVFTGVSFLVFALAVNIATLFASYSV